jgi:EAL domain-containing protein (putative c-di-GMP-specific phosphodiesterase class I)
VPAHDDPSPPAPPQLVPPADPPPRSSRRTREAVGDVLAHGAVEIGFQAVVDLVSQQPVGFEALARGPEGTELEAPGALFAAAREAGRLDELDWLCQREALRAALRAGLRAPSVLFVNVEADASGFLPLDLRALYAQATAEMVVAVELTERALMHRPAALLGRVADMRALGCTVALDDVGTAPDSLAMMAVLAPDVVKLDLAELAGRPARDLAEVVDAVAAHAERAGTTVLVERIETEEEARLAATIGARLAQGWLFGPREPLVTAPAPPPERPVHASRQADPRDVTPFQLVAEGREVRRASRELLVGLSRHLEEQARAVGRGAVLVGGFEDDASFDADARERYAKLAEELAFCGAVGTGMAPEPAPGVHGGRLHASDPLAREWTVALVSAHASAALSAHDPGTGEYEYVLTHDRALAAAATAALMARIPS